MDRITRDYFVGLFTTKGATDMSHVMVGVK